MDEKQGIIYYPWGLRVVIEGNFRSLNRCNTDAVLTLANFPVINLARGEKTTY